MKMLLGFILAIVIVCKSQEYRWIMAGKPSQFDFYPECRMSTENTASLANNYVDQGVGYNIAVSCCTPEGTTGVRPDCSARYSDGGVTFDEAALICSDAGYRLCSRIEMEADLTAGTGCSFDAFYNWVNTSCEPSHHIIQDGSSSETFLSADCVVETSNQAISVNEYGGYDIYASCCAQNGSFGWRGDCTNPVTFYEAMQICSENEYRLCTLAELEADLTEGLGCSADARYSWTSDVCDPTSAPTSDPSSNPSFDPTRAPTTAPTTDPSANPTSDPTHSPSSDPSFAPTSDPSSDPSADPSNAPTADPSSSPTTDPTNAPTVSPTSYPTPVPTTDPTNFPSKHPTVSPTEYPTASPLCLGAKYQGSMYCDDNECDELWGGESLVSANCDYLMVMEMNGNLAVYAESDNANRRRLLSDGRPVGWYFGWSSGTSVANVSGRSIPVFTLDSDGSMSILEYTDGANGDDFEILWSYDTESNSSAFTFDLAEDGCLEMNTENETLWEMCSDSRYIPTKEPTVRVTMQPTRQPTVEHVDTTSSDGDSEVKDAGNTDFETMLTDLTVKDYIIICLVGIIVIFCFCICCLMIVLCCRRSKRSEKDAEEVPVQSPESMVSEQVDSPGTPIPRSDDHVDLRHVPNSSMNHVVRSNSSIHTTNVSMLGQEGTLHIQQHIVPIAGVGGGPSSLQMTPTLPADTETEDDNDTLYDRASPTPGAPKAD